MRGAPGAESSLRPMAVAETQPGVHLPAPQKEQGQQVLPRLALWGSEPRGAQDKQQTGGKRESGRRKGRHGACLVRAQAGRVLLPEVLGWPSPSESKNPVLHPQSGPTLWVPGGLPQGCHQQL